MLVQLGPHHAAFARDRVTRRAAEALVNRSAFSRISYSGRTGSAAERSHEGDHRTEFCVGEAADAWHAPIGNAIADDGAQLLVGPSLRQHRPIQIRALTSPALHAVASGAHAEEKLFALFNVPGLSGAGSGDEDEEGSESRH